MSIFRRAWLYITRKRSRSIMLLIIMILTAVFTMLGLVIKSSTDKEIDNLRKSLCSSFNLSINEENKSLWTMEYGEQGQAYEIYTGSRITTDITKRITETNYVTNCLIYSLVSVWFDLELRSGNYVNWYQRYKEHPEEIPFDLPLDYYQVNSQVTDLYGCSESERYEPFRIGAFELSQGRHIIKDDQYKTIISTALAERNNLSIGDTITAEARDVTYTYGGDPNKIIGEPMKLEIVGIFNINFKQEAAYLTSASTGETNIFTFEKVFAENMIFCDLYSVQQMLTTIYDYKDYPSEEITTYNDATFFVDDPKNLDAAIAEVKALDEIQPEYFTIEPDDAAYRASAEPLKNLSTFSTVLIVTVIIACIVLLGLLMNMWTKGRKREMGILLSMGVKKRNIVMQQLLECIILALLALILAIVISGLFADSFGRFAEKIMTPTTTTSEMYEVESVYHKPVINKVSTDPVDLEYGLTVQNILIVAAVVMGSTAGSVLVTSRNVLKMKPKDVLSSM